MECKPYRDSPSEKARWDKADCKSRPGTSPTSKKAVPVDEAQAKHAADTMDFAEEKARIIEIQQDIEADEEFEQLKVAPTVVEPKIARTLFARSFVRGFRMYVFH
jgi:hypothetical protein